jgi:hypothetical protein
LGCSFLMLAYCRINGVEGSHMERWVIANL